MTRKGAKENFGRLPGKLRANQPLFFDQFFFEFWNPDARVHHRQHLSAMEDQTLSECLLSLSQALQSDGEKATNEEEVGFSDSTYWHRIHGGLRFALVLFFMNDFCVHTLWIFLLQYRTYLLGGCSASKTSCMRHPRKTSSTLYVLQGPLRYRG